MKSLSRRQLRRIIREVTVQVSPDDISKAKTKIAGAGGAIDSADLEAEFGTDDIPGDAALDAIVAADEDLVLHAKGDVIDVSGLNQQIAESKMRRLVRKAILEALR